MRNASAKLIRGLMRRHWLALFSGGTGAVVLTLAQLAQPFPLQWVIDHVIGDRTGGFALDGAGLRALWIAGLAVVVISAVSAGGTYVAEIGLSRAGERIAHDLRVATYAHLQRLSLAFHDRRQKGDLVTRLTEDANQVGELFSESIGTMTQAVLILVGRAAVTFLLAPLLALAMFAVTPVLGLVTVHYRRKVKLAARHQRASEGEIASLAAESLSAMRVVKAFGGERYEHERARPVLEDVSLRVRPGEHVAVVGSSGAGKSTIGALIARFYDPVSGRVEIDGRDARDWSLPWLRDQIGILLQDTVLFTGTVAENIAYGATATREEIVAAAQAAGAHDFISRLPGGYDEPLGPQGVGLSGGQRQRLGIARVLLRNPPILLLDEPTTGLDALSEANLVGSLRALMHGRTTIIVTHSMSLAATADRARGPAGGGRRRLLRLAGSQPARAGSDLAAGWRFVHRRLWPRVLSRPGTPPRTQPGAPRPAALGLAFRWWG